MEGSHEMEESHEEVMKVEGLWRSCSLRLEKNFPMIEE